MEQVNINIFNHLFSISQKNEFSKSEFFILLNLIKKDEIVVENFSKMWKTSRQNVESIYIKS